MTKEEITDPKDSVNPEDKSKKKTEEESSEKMIAESEFKSVVQQSIDRKKKIKELEDQLRAKDEALAKTQNDYKTLYETEKTSREAAEGENSRIKESLVMEKKWSAVESAAVKAGIRDDALDDLSRLPLSEVLVETTSTGKINVLGVEQFIAKLKAKKPHWFETRNTRLNPDTPTVNGGKRISWDDVAKARTEANKTGDWTKYKKLEAAWTKENN